MKGLKRALKVILGAKDITIASHINPDGDSIGSLLGLGLGLRQLGKRVTMLSPGGVPAMYKRLPGAKEILRRTNKVPELAIAVDCGGSELLGETFGLFQKSGHILEIDHHEIRYPFGDTRIVEPSSASVGELVYRILTELKVDITRNITENILTSIIVETNSFRLPNIRPRTFEICAKLLKTGVDFSRLSEMVYWSKPKRASMLIGFCLSKCKFSRSDRLVWCILKRRDLKRMKARDEDADSVTSELLAIKGVAIAVFFREKNKKYLRVSLRSKYGANVARLAQFYGGGGHLDAAGCVVANSSKAMRELLNGARRLLG